MAELRSLPSVKSYDAQRERVGARPRGRVGYDSEVISTRDGVDAKAISNMPRAGLNRIFADWEVAPNEVTRPKRRVDQGLRAALMTSAKNARRCS